MVVLRVLSNYYSNKVKNTSIENIDNIIVSYTFIYIKYYSPINYIGVGSKNVCIINKNIKKFIKNFQYGDVYNS